MATEEVVVNGNEDEDEDENNDDEATAGDAGGAWPARLVRAETVLAKRTERFLLVLEHCADRHNRAACYRTAETLGVQHVWEVLPPSEKPETVNGRRRDKPAARAPGGRHGPSTIGTSAGAEKWLSTRTFHGAAECAAALRELGYTIWATHLAPGAARLSAQPGPDGSPPLQVPPKVAVVMGSEVAGVSDAMLSAADRRVYLEQAGFTESFNLSVATALVLQALFTMCPEARGDLSDERKQAVREVWYPKVFARSKTAVNRERHLPFLEKARRGELPEALADLRTPRHERKTRSSPG